MTNTPERPMPLFYRKPQPLMPVIHDDVRLKDGDYGFAAEANSVPLAVVEFAQAMRFYPIVFAEGGNFPVAVLGLTAANGFVSDGRWAENHYVPAYVRRYPFVFAEAGEQGFALALDVDSERVVRSGDDGVALFENGKPTPLTQGAMVFCREFHQAHLQTEAFIAALAVEDLLVVRQADARSVGGDAFQLKGFRVIDTDKLAVLPDATVLDWHKKGWLALIHFHLASLDRFADLLARQAGTAGAGGTGTETPAVPEAEDRTAAPAAA